MKKIITIWLFIQLNVFSQGISGTSAKYESVYLVDIPTAGIVSKGFSLINIELMPEGVLISKVQVGVFERFSIGISYGGNNIIGSGKIDFYKWPGINIKGRIIDESVLFPALAIGFDSQGKGLFDKYRNRYQYKSPGIFIAASKNFELLGYLSLHSIINYSLERDDSDKDLNFGFGFEKTIGPSISVVSEYNVAFNDNTGLAFGKGNGYLHFGFRIDIGDGLTLGLDLRDILKNKKINSNAADRALFVNYIKGIF